MYKVSAKEFDEDLKDYLDGLVRDLPKATASMLTWMGQAAKKKVTERMPELFDRPVPWTVNSTYLQAATAESLAAEVYIKRLSINSLEHHIDGGKRPAKGLEKLMRSAGILRGSHQYVVPGRGMKLDAYGNIPRGQVNKILSAIGAQRDVGVTSNTSARSRRRNKNQARYFVVSSGALSISGRRRLPPGVWWKRDKTRITPLLLFVKSTSYKRRYPFFEIVEDAAYDAMPAAADRALERFALR